MKRKLKLLLLFCSGEKQGSPIVCPSERKKTSVPPRLCVPQRGKQGQPPFSVPQGQKNEGAPNSVV